MTVMRVAIDEKARWKYTLRGAAITFEELLMRIRSKESVERLRELHRIAERSGLRRMTKREIEAEVQAVRDAARRP